MCTGRAACSWTAATKNCVTSASWARAWAVNGTHPNLGPRIGIHNRSGDVLARLGDDSKGSGEGPAQFLAPHGVAVDSHGDIYVAEVSWTSIGQHQNPPRELQTLRKLVKRS